MKGPMFLLLTGCASAFFLLDADSRHADQEMSTKNPELILAFAEQFVVAISREDPSVKSMVAYPFMFYAPCKGGVVSEFDGFKAMVLSRLGGVGIPPKGYDKRSVVPIEHYFRSFTGESVGDEKSRQAHIDELGRDVRVAYLFSKKQDRCGMAVLVRATHKGLRAVGIGVVDLAAEK